MRRPRRSALGAINGRKHPPTKARGRNARHRGAGVHRRRFGPRDAHRRRRRPVHHGAAGHDLAGLRHRSALGAILADQPLVARDETIVMVNGLGGTPLIESYVVFNEVAPALAGKGVVIARSLVGNSVTSLDMAGVSITVCKADADMLSLWDAPVNTPALRWDV
ncbi:dihydroxyacetone kinase subunit DhaK [Streptomyces sp. HUCO-GS316]|uniref:dihydroxyacetone kinase subunit DhaK n=1 Tax=Streptomyces sp. HUCO-GS316 TaxID=2692198 RepID=UPI00301C5A14